MSGNCTHEKARITVDDGAGGTKEVCPICDDVQVETLDQE